MICLEMFRLRDGRRNKRENGTENFTTILFKRYLHGQVPRLKHLITIVNSLIKFRTVP